MSLLALRHVHISALALSTAASMSLVLLAAAPSEAAATGKVDVVVKTPDGVAANALLDGPVTQVFAKGEEGKKLEATRSLEPGRYRVKAPMVTADGILYEATAPESVEVKAGRTAEVTVVYATVGSAKRLRATRVFEEGVQLRWAQPDGTTVALRRTPWNRAARDVTEGTEVATVDGTANDTGITAGVGYTYSLFTQLDGGWVGPLVIRVKTPSPTRHAAAVLPRSSTVLLKGDADRISATGTGVRVAVPEGEKLPVIGSGVSVRPNQLLPGGYLGRVVAVAKDGSSYRVEAGGLADVVDYLDADLDIDHVGEIAMDPMPQPTPRTVYGQQQRSLLPTGAKSAQRVAQGDCLHEGIAEQVSATTATMDPGGRFTTSLRAAPGTDPTATYDLDLSFDSDLAVDVDTADGVQCQTYYRPVYVKLVARPVPIVLGVVPIVAVSADNGVAVSDFGVTVDSGFRVAGDFGQGDEVADGSGLYFDDATPKQATPTTTGNVLVGMGGYAALGALGSAFGQSGNPQMAAMVLPAAMQGDTYFTDPGDPRKDSCLVSGGYAQTTTYMDRSGFLGGEDDPGQATVEEQLPYDLDPWFVPEGCENTPHPITALAGEGVEIDDLTTEGGGEQFGHFEGFAPGEDAWVLSTGLVQDAVGEPSKQADTQLGLPGSEFLTSLSGSETHDQATMTVDLTPTGNKLHVRYAFASEEYPEYVGGGVNDVMAVLVDGENCAFVPGTSTPVSIDTINDHTNAEYYVDNATGAAGYNSSMDGITTPLECEVPVTPGEPVEVSVMLADGGDAAYDSAIALLDGGIWSDGGP